MTLSEVCRDVIVIAYREDTAQLEAALAAEGFGVSVQRGAYSPQELQYPAIIRALLNHVAAWRRVQSGDRPMIIVEADFVPCRGFGRLPLPAPPSDRTFAYLYAGSPILYGADQSGRIYGHAAATVAYCLSPAVAGTLLEFAETELRDPETYSGWDSRLSMFLRDARGVRTYLPLYQYGEHGGLPNPEHKAAGLRAIHRADILAAPLAFVPAYGAPRRHRLAAWAYAVARLVTLRFFHPHHVNEQSSRGRPYLAWVSASRLLRLQPLH